LASLQRRTSKYSSPSLRILSNDPRTAINGGLNVTNLLASIVGALLAERLGRRKLWMSSFIGMILIFVPFIALSATYATKKSKGAGYGVIACLFLFDIMYNVACNPLLYSYPTEIMPFFMRTKGLAVKNFVGQIALIINMYVNPIALAKIGYHYYIFFLVLNVGWLTLIYMFFPETKGYTLEEMSMLFDGDENVVLGLKIVSDLEDGPDGEVESMSAMPKKE
jgi:MFS family permease